MNKQDRARGAVRTGSVPLLLVAGLGIFFVVSGGGNEGRGQGAAASEAVPLASFRALYELSLKRAEGGSGIESYRGLMVVRWAESCEGYASDQHMAAIISDMTGTQIYSEFFSSSWEARDQTLFRFSMMTKLDDDVSREVLGQAGRETGAAGSILFTKPEEGEYALGGDVLFPSEYSNRLIRAAQEGDRVFQANLFDGSDGKVVYSTVSFIGDVGNSDDVDGEADRHSLLAGLDYWPIRASYHNLDTKEELPEFEIGMRMYANGVATDLVLDYGDFALGGKLLKLEDIVGDDC